LIRKAQQENPHDVASLSILARISERQQKMAEAAEWHRHLSVVAPPNNKESYRFLAQFYYDQAEYQAALPYWEHLARSEPANRVYHLSWLLARIHTCGIHGVKPHLAEVERWWDFTLEERSLAHALFLTAGKASLDEDLALAEHYGVQALGIAQSADGTSFLAEVEQRKAAQPCDHGRLSLFPPSTQKEPLQPLKPLSPERLMEQVLFLSMEEGRQIRRARRREGLQRIGKRAALFLLLIGGLVGFATLYETCLSLPLREKTEIKGEEQGSALLPEKPSWLSPPDTTETTEKGRE